MNSAFAAYLLPFISAALITLLLMPLVMRLAHRVGAVDHPDARRVHRQATPRMGGLGLLLTLIVLPSTMLEMNAPLIGFIIGLIMIGFTGIADDILSISPRWKFAGIAAGAVIFLYLSGASVSNLGNLFGFGDVVIGWFALPFTLFGMIGLINAINLSDGLDGLAAGISLIAAFFLAAFALVVGDSVGLILSMILSGTLIGFLYFNSHPARVFMGDTGSLILGYTLAAITLLLLKDSSGAGISPISMGLLLGLPLADTIFVMGRRIRQGVSPFEPDKTHFHHRLLALGISHAGAVAIFYGLSFLFGAVALLTGSLGEWVQSLGLIALLVLTYTSLGWIERSGFRFSADTQAEDTGPAHAHPLYARATHWLGISIPVVTWLIPILLLPPVFALQPNTMLAQFEVVALVMALLLYPWHGNRASSWAHGLIYLLVFSLLVSFNFAATPEMREYLFLVTLALSGWVVLKLCFKRNRRVFLTTGLESLLLLFSWGVPLVAAHLNPDPGEMQTRLYVVCAQTVVFLLATKIVLRRQPERNKTLLAALIALSAAAVLQLA